MLDVFEYTVDYEAKVTTFLKQAHPSLKVEQKIIDNAILVVKEGKLMGMVSYESRNHVGVIRYFLYDNGIAGTDLIIKMFMKLYQKAYHSGVKQLVAKVPSESVTVLFEQLGFHQLPDKRSCVIHLEESA
jgi:citrate lyase synthetase